MENQNERNLETELSLLDSFLEHALAKMEIRKFEIEEEAYLYAKCVSLPKKKKIREWFNE